MMKHRGEIVEKAIRESGYSITRLADRLGKSRRWMYHSFENRNLSIEIILTIGEIIHHDFSTEIVGLTNYKNQGSAQLVQEEKSNYKAKNDEAAMWKDKYLDLLEKYNKVLTEISEKKVKPSVVKRKK